MAISWELFVALTVGAICAVIGLALPALEDLFRRQAGGFSMGNNRSTLDFVRTVNAINGRHREHRSNCKSCGAPVPTNGVCKYCGTDNALETRKTKIDGELFSSADNTIAVKGD